MNELSDFFNTTGFSQLDYRHLVMIIIGAIFIYLAVSKDWEPYELLPMGLGILIANLPLTGLMVIPNDGSGFQEAGIFGVLFHCQVVLVFIVYKVSHHITIIQIEK